MVRKLKLWSSKQDINFTVCSIIPIGEISVSADFIANTLKFQHIFQSAGTASTLSAISDCLADGNISSSISTSSPELTAGGIQALRSYLAQIESLHSRDDKALPLLFVNISAEKSKSQIVSLRNFNALIDRMYPLLRKQLIGISHSVRHLPTSRPKVRTSWLAEHILTIKVVDCARAWTGHTNVENLAEFPLLETIFRCITVIYPSVAESEPTGDASRDSDLEQEEELSTDLLSASTDELEASVALVGPSGGAAVSLCQTYQMVRSFARWPYLHRCFEEVTEFAMAGNFSHTDTDGFRYPRGRRYDDAMFLTMAAELDFDWSGKTVCEIGARDSIFSSYLAAKTDVGRCLISDYFQEWDGLGDIQQWSELWLGVAGDGKTKLTISQENILNLSHPPESVDVVVCKAVLEHVLWQTRDCCGHHQAMHEIQRVLRPRGLVFISTQIIGWDRDQSVRFSGTHYWSTSEFSKQLLSIPGLSLIGKPEFQMDFNFSAADADDVRYYDNEIGPCSSVVFVLTKH